MQRFAGRHVVVTGGGKGIGRAIAERPAHPNRARALRMLHGKSGAIDEADGAKLLAYYGVRRPKERAVRTPAQAAAFARTIGFPVAVKALAQHRSRLKGAVTFLSVVEEECNGSGAGALAASRNDPASTTPRIANVCHGHALSSA